MNTLGRRLMFNFALPFNKTQFHTIFKTHQKRRVKAGKKMLKTDAPLVQQSSFGAFPKKYQKRGIKKSSSRWDVSSVNGIPKKRKNNFRFQKAKKSIERLQVEVAERRGYTKCMKELAMDEAQAFATCKCNCRGGSKS